MAIIDQLVYKPHRCMANKNDTSALQSYPQRRDVYTRVYTTVPRKPNSALRKVYRVHLTSGFEVFSYIGNEGHDLQEYNAMLIHGGCVEDPLGVHHHTVCSPPGTSGVRDCKQSRSKYGVRHPK